MARFNKEAFATENDLKWFKLENYAALPGKDANNFQSPESQRTLFATWASIIRDRVELLHLLEAGDIATVTEQFGKIKTAPLTPLGFDQKYGGGKHIGDTTAVKSLTVNRVHWLNEAMIDRKASPRETVDIRLQGDSENAFSDYAHLMISLHASDSQLMADFQSWLAERRKSTVKVTQGDYVAKIGQWILAQAVPGKDLQLFTQITGKQITVASKLEMLFPRYPGASFEALHRKHADNVQAAFTDDMAKIIWQLANR